MREHVDSPDMVVGLLAAIGALIVALAAFSIIDMDDTEQRRPLPPPVYVTMPPVAP